jgi:hypothetical protein
MSAGHMVPIRDESDDRLDQHRAVIRAAQIERANRHNQDKAEAMAAQAMAQIANGFSV